ncbi:hypothetical protein B0T19DRAFT_402085 [Cercophora scortea]|uniref:Uncharacterized protein n=1 Tax=Cercophora scortea TaxID=314031 RepID=A0AAE0M8W7_9PEZI|nr:hypothetical protein B0T19DRAFT_402085 [Cercophora scortea]
MFSRLEKQGRLAKTRSSPLDSNYTNQSEVAAKPDTRSLPRDCSTQSRHADRWENKKRERPEDADGECQTEQSQKKFKMGSPSLEAAQKPFLEPAPAPAPAPTLPPCNIPAVCASDDAARENEKILNSPSAPAASAEEISRQETPKEAKGEEEESKEEPAEPSTSTAEAWDDDEEEEDDDDLRFEGTFFHRSKEEAIEFAKAAISLEETRDDRYPTVLLGDSSFPSNGADPRYVGAPGGYAIVYREAGKWVVSAFPVAKMFSTGWGEIAAICEELNLAITRIERARQLSLDFVPGVIRVFSGSTGSMKLLESRRYRGKHNQTIIGVAEATAKRMAMKLSRELKNLGATVEVHYLPGHGHDVTPFMMADTTSRTARQTLTSSGTTASGAVAFEPIGQKLADETLDRVNVYKQAISPQLDEDELSVDEIEALDVSDKDKRRLLQLKSMSASIKGKRVKFQLKQQWVNLYAKVGHLLIRKRKTKQEGGGVGQ